MPIQPKVSARQEVLLDELVGVFLAEGFSSFTLDELAARLHCSKATLYALAPSKEQLVVRVVRRFFERATARVEADVVPSDDVRAQVTGYLTAVARELSPASPAFYADVAAFGPTEELYRRNTVIAGRRVQELVSDGVRDGATRSVHAAFVGAAAATVMTAIQRGEILAVTGLADATAYAELAELLLVGLAAG